MRTLSCIIAALMLAASLSATPTPAQRSDFFLWSQSNGQNVMVLNDGSLATVQIQWVGLSAWYDLTGIKTWFNGVISAGQVPYFQDYSIGDLVYNTRDISYASILSFDVSLAKMIGNNFAIVNIDTEWDAAGIYEYALATAGIANFKSRIQTFRTYAPNTILTSSPGLWTAAYGDQIGYSKWKPVDALLDYRSVLYSAVSSDSGCTWRNLAGTSGTTVFTTGATISAAEQTATILNNYHANMNTLWGTTTRKWFAADVAVTDCGWGVTGQAAIIQNLVNNLPTMFANGFRGMAMRNQSPPDEYRDMGQNNEAGFTWYPPSSGKNNTSVAINNGLNIIINLMKSKSTTATTTKAVTTTKAGTTTKAPTTSTTTIAVSQVTGSWNSWWIQVSVTPASKVSQVTAKYTDLNGVVRTLTLAVVSGTSSTQYYGAPPAAIPIGAAVTITVLTTTGTTQTFTVYNGSPITASKTLPGWNSYWIQVSLSTTTGVSSLAAQYTDSSNTLRRVTLAKNAYGQYQAAPPSQIPYGATVTIYVYTTDGSSLKQTLTNGQSLTVASVSNAWNRWWIQISVNPNTNVKSITAKFTDATKVARTITLTAIANTNQYMGNPTTTMPSGAPVTISITLKDGTVQTYTITNPVYSREAIDTPESTKPNILHILLSIVGTLVVTAGIAVVVLGILKFRHREPTHVILHDEDVMSPQTPVDNNDIELQHTAVNEDTVTIQELPL